MMFLALAARRTLSCASSAATVSTLYITFHMLDPFYMIQAIHLTLPVVLPSFNGMFSPIVVVERSGPGLLPVSSPNLTHFLR